MLVCALMPVDNAGATQVHGGPEGLYVHQIAHFFFMFSMAILIYWLRERRLVQEKGWRFVQYAAFFFYALECGCNDCALSGRAKRPV